jgi:crotonobetainyl-CoA:carnitine CoA-transferase CaiB-like acyl-CoA transferase
MTEPTFAAAPSISSQGPLAGIRVLDMSRVLAGPWCGQMLGDLGAEVIKIEIPEKGDDTRGWGPPYLKDAHGETTAESAYFSCANRNKRSVAIDMTSAEGQALLRDLAAKSDVVLENFKFGGLKKYGLDYESLSKINPRLVYCSITGFGQTGPLKAKAGYDFMIQALGGLMSVTGEMDHLPGGGPQKVGVAVVDVMTGMYASTAVLGALYARTHTGRGQYIDLALFDVQVAFLANQTANYLVSGEPPVRLGNAHPSIVPYQAFKTATDYIILAVGNDGQFARFCELAGHSQAASDPRFSTNAARVTNRATLVPMVAEWMLAKPAAQWLAELDIANVPCGAISNMAQVFEMEQTKARGLRVELPHPLAGSVPVCANPIRYSDTPVTYRAPPPLLGEGTNDVLSRVLGLSADDIEGLKAKGVVG